MASFCIGGPAETPGRTINQSEIALTQDPAQEARNFDIPFLRDFKDAAKFYLHTNDPADTSSTWGAQYNSKAHTACGNPANASWLSGFNVDPLNDSWPSQVEPE